jgi:glutathione S-transferase
VTIPIQLYAFDTPNGRKISAALEEMGLPYDVHVVDIGKREQFDPAFLAISPNNKIPAIVDPDGPGGAPVSVFESGAILIYLGEKTGLFWPREPRAHIATLEWLMFQIGGSPTTRTSPAPSWRSPTSRSSAGPGATRATAPTWPTSRTSSAGTTR